MADAEEPNNYPMVIISQATKDTKVFAIRAGSPEFDGSAPGCRQLQLKVEPIIYRGCTCSKSTANSRLKVETPVSSGGWRRTAVRCADPGGFGEGRSAIRISFVQRRSIPAPTIGRTI